MLSKLQIKHIASLRQKKFREKHRLFIVEGEKSVQELIQSDYQIWDIFSAEQGVIRHPKVTRISEKDLERISGLKTPNKVLAVARIPSTKISPKEIKNRLILALDGVTDPGNLGTIIRVADWFGIDAVLCSTNCVDSYNPKVVQSAMGSLFRIQIRRVELPTFLRSLKDVPIYGAVLDGENIYEAHLTPIGIIVIGGESHGISREVLERIQVRLTIPSNRKVASLNAGVATGIVCSEFVRRAS